MNVKCPKCRYRFDAPASPGMTELQCNCPRCGTPFTFDISENKTEAAPRIHSSVVTNAEQKEENSSETVSLTSSAQRVNMEAAIPSGNQQENDKPLSEGSDGSNDKTIKRNNTQQAVPPRSAQWQPSPLQSSHPINPFAPGTEGALHRYIMVAVLLIIIFFAGKWLLHWTMRSNASNQDSTSVNLNIKEGDVQQYKYDERIPTQPVPTWLEGTWRYDTEYGGIVVKIKGNKVSETSGGRTLHGDFVYQDGIIFGDFGKGGTFNYRVLEETKHLDCGNGMIMQKIR